jgi:adenylate cyclase
VSGVPHDDDDRDELARRARAMGATDAEVERSVNLGELVLDLTLRPRSGRTVGDVVDEIDMDDEALLRLLRSTGLPALRDDPVTEAEAATIHMLASVSGDFLGEDVTRQLGRVAGLAMSRVAEAIVTAFRLRFELPRRAAGTPYVDVIEQYAAVASTILPAFVDSLDVLLRQNILSVAERMWSTDDDGATVTLPRAIGFVDLVGYTEASATMSVRELTATLIEFDDRTASAALQGGGQIVKTIGDEAMFVADDSLSACRIGLALVELFGHDAIPPVRVGIAAGDVVSVFGDVYGPEVNLAARLVATAEPSTVLVSERVAAACAGHIEVEPLPPLTLKGFAAPVPAYRLR